MHTPWPFIILLVVGIVVLVIYSAAISAHGYMNIDPWDYYASFDLEYWREWWCSTRTDCWT
jgi:hypothetical protein